MPAVVVQQDAVADEAVVEQVSAFRLFGQRADGLDDESGRRVPSESEKSVVSSGNSAAECPACFLRFGSFDENRDFVVVTVKRMPPANDAFAPRDLVLARVASAEDNQAAVGNMPDRERAQYA